ncbi:hypothetical protein ACFVUS_28310 [Nocardia sp. NPDC058058]|uniref:hypothetical protein n=1 Tax=Nocardia sp. NPDC058058 TaxID=3346317 RepID=UPI0036DF6A1A
MELVNPSSGDDFGRKDTRYFENELGYTVLTGLGGVALFGVALLGGMFGQIVGGLLIAFVLAMIAGPAWRLIRHKPLLVVTDQGISHREFGLVPWTAVDHVWVRLGRDDQPLTPIRVQLNDTGPDFASAPTLDIAVDQLPASPEAVLDAMRKHNPHLVTFIY